MIDEFRRSNLYKLREGLRELSDEDIDELVELLFCDWFDERKCLDEQIHVNLRMHNNFLWYEAREAEAKAKYLYAKANQIERAGK